MPDNLGSPQLELVEEKLVVDKREIERGKVVIHTKVDTRKELTQVDLRHEEVSVERVSIGHFVEMAPATRNENGVLIVPVLEERAVVTTRLFLKEEIRITKRTRVETLRQAVQLRFEHADVIRYDGNEAEPTTSTEGRNDNG